MEWATIRKATPCGPVVPNLLDYVAARRSFSWEAARRRLAPSSGGLNIGYVAVDRHATGANADKVALRFVERDGGRRSITYRQLQQLTNRFANVLADLEVDRGERVFLLLGRCPELFVAMLGAFKHGAVVSPLFSAFGPEPVRQRLLLGDGAVVVTTPQFYEHKLAAVRDSLPALRHVLVVSESDDDAAPAGTLSLGELMATASDEYAAAPTQPGDMALLHFTSGTTGAPKGAVHVHEAVVSHETTARYALDLHADDVFWCTADPGWVTGTSYGVIAPLVLGVTSVVDVGEFDANRWYGILQDEHVNVWYTAPTALRMLMRAGAALAHEYDLSALRFVASVGEPLNPEAVVWGCDAFGLPVHDNWWQTETGGIMIANFASMDIRPGSMGRPLPGVEATVLERDDQGGVRLLDGAPVAVDRPGVEGHLALQPGWPSMFRGYLHDDERYRASFVGGWYVTGDLVRRDQDGYYWFVGRADDVIKSAGHLIGPFEVESALMEHPAVVEAGVIGVPDAVAGEIVKAFVSLHRGYVPSAELRRELIAFGRKRLGAAVAPRSIEFDQHLPKTRSGKIMRRVLKARELAQPSGDLSTLEETR